MNASMTAVADSGIRIMSDSLIPFQPAIDEPSNILPSSKHARIDGVGGDGDMLFFATRIREAAGQRT